MAFTLELYTIYFFLYIKSNKQEMDNAPEGHKGDNELGQPLYTKI